MENTINPGNSDNIAFKVWNAAFAYSLKSD